MSPTVLETFLLSPRPLLAFYEPSGRSGELAPPRERHSSRLRYPNAVYASSKHFGLRLHAAIEPKTLFQARLSLTVTIDNAHARQETKRSSKIADERLSDSPNSRTTWLDRGS